MEKRVAVVILNWNSYGDTERCIRSVLQSDYSASFPVVVDNASTDGSYERLRAEFPELELIRSERNLGYAGGNNLGIARALELGADYVYVINNDTEVPVDSVRLLVEAIEADERIGQAGPKVEDATIGRIGAVGGQLLWDLALPVQVGNREEDRGQYRETLEVDFVPGTAVLVRREALEQVGPIPESYFMYFEDVVWSLMFQRAGWKSVAVPRARIVHWESSSLGRFSPVKTYYQVRNNLAFIDQWVPEVERRSVHRRFRVRLTKMAVKGALARSLPQIRAIAAGYRDYYAGRMGATERRFTNQR